MKKIVPRWKIQATVDNVVVKLKIKFSGKMKTKCSEQNFWEKLSLLYVAELNSELHVYLSLSFSDLWSRDNATY